MNQTGALSNTYIPPLPPKTTFQILNRLATKSLYDLSELWARWAPTQRQLTREEKDDGLTQSQMSEIVVESIRSMREKKQTKVRLINAILVDFWRTGLNLLQLAQCDIQYIVDKPNNYSWISSTAKFTNGENYTFSLDSQVFLDRLVHELGSLYLVHVYISKHPHFPLTLVRVQLFDTGVMKRESRSKSKSPDIFSRKPYYLAIPLSSSQIIHGETRDQLSKLILQAVERSISSSVKQIRLSPNTEAPVKNLESMHIFKGVSRFSQSIGPWAKYADGTVDRSPLADPKEVETEQPVLDEESERKAIANIRFKGSAEPLQPDRLFEDTRPVKQRKLEHLVENRNYDKSQYSSIAPIQFARFDLSDRECSEVNIRMRLRGNDIFGGLHEMCARGDADARRIPSWLTGEEGMSSGVITDGVFETRDFYSEKSSGGLI